MRTAIYPLHSGTCGFSRQACRFFLAGLPEGVEIVDDPARASLILVFDSYDNRMIGELSWEVLISSKTVMYSEGDAGVPVLPGIYVNLTKRHYRPGRTGSHGYLFYLAENRGNSACRGVQAVEKRFLFSFAGRNSHRVRADIFRLLTGAAEAYIRDTSQAYDHWSADRPEEMQSRYAETIRQSYFSLCPRGKGANCIRLFESMRMGVAPVLISDAWVLPEGPDWEQFLIRIPESQVAEIPGILERERHRALEMGELARKAYEAYFSASSLPRDVLTQLERMVVENHRDLPVRLLCLVENRAVEAFWFCYFLAIPAWNRVKSILRRFSSRNRVRELGEGKEEL